MGFQQLIVWFWSTACDLGIWLPYTYNGINNYQYCTVQSALSFLFVVLSLFSYLGYYYYLLWGENGGRLCIAAESYF
jgi:hypothetical protein